MSTMYVKPVGRIRQPDRSMKPMPEDGATVNINNPYYASLLARGDIVKATKPEQAAVPKQEAKED